MSDSSERLSKLSAAKQALLEERMRGMSGANVEVRIPVRPQSGTPAPLSFGQQRLWFMEQLRPGNLAYNISSAVRLSGHLDAHALTRALDEIVRRHEVLRTTFSTRDALPVQIVMPHESLNLEAEDFSGVDEGSRENEIKRVLAEESLRPFDLSRNALCRFRFLRFSAEDHALLWTLHHIISDEWSTGIFMRELTALYTAFSRGEASPLPELPIQYADYAIWQREWLQGEVLERQLRYWREKLSGEPPMLELPADHPRPPLQGFAGAREVVVLSPELTQRLNALAKEEGATSFMTMLAAFKALLARYTGQTDIVVGTPIANRGRVDTEKLIGFFVNTLVLRTDLSGNPSFRELLKRVRETSLGAYSHQDLPFEKLVEEIDPERDIGQNPLFQVMFTLHTVTTLAAGLQGVGLSHVESDSSATRFDLELHVIESAKSLVVICVYNTDLFEAATVARMLEHFRMLLESIAAHPDQPVFRLPLLTPVEREQMLVHWNRTDKEYPGAQLVHEFFEAQAERTPDNAAVRTEAGSLTYAELNRRANQLAHHLRRRGVGADVVTGVLMERSLEMMVAVLGILKAGGVYVSLDPTYPDERLRAILDNAQPPVILSQEHLRQRVPVAASGHAAQVVSIEADWPAIAQERAENPIRQSGDEHLTYIIYTSGSTGTPKGVGLPHRSLVNFVHWMREMQPEPLQTMQFASLNFDVSFMEMFSTWSTGGTLILVPEMLRQDVIGLGRFIVEHRVEKTVLPVVVLQQLAEFYLQEQIATSLREIIVTGEQFRVTSALRKLFEERGTCVLYNQYGPSETHVVTSYTMAAEPSAWPTLPPIGRPIANARLYVLDENFEPVPVGVKGELYIGGTSPGRGYPGRPELTAEKFVPDPFSLTQGARLYRSGDIVRYTSEGYVEFVERRDQQVKIRGFRVELGEIEAVLVQHERVAEAVVVAREAGSGGVRQLVAYVVGLEGGAGAVTTADLRRHLKEHLPEYMMPATFVWLEALPLTPNGKVDRKALPLPDQQRPELGSNYVAPHTKTEEVLAGIWSELLGINLIGRHDDFFELGGHSMLILQLISKVNQAFQIELSVLTFFENPTLSGLAQSIEAALEARAV